MVNRLTRILAIGCITSVCLFLIVFFLPQGFSRGIEESVGDPFLARPALAADDNTTFLDQESGMSLYFNAAQTLDLAKAKEVYKTIESETSTYLIGSISLPGLPETDDVHCWVQKDGWVVVYYLKEEPVSKIVDWIYYTGGQLNNDKLKEGLEQICTALGLTPSNATYYDFQYPYANKWMLIIESQTGDGADSFNLQVPSAFLVYERSWSHRAGTGTATNCGSLAQTQLVPDVFHKIVASASSSCDWGSCTYSSGLSIDGAVIDTIGSKNTSEIAIALIYREG